MAKAKATTKPVPKSGKITLVYPDGRRESRAVSTVLDELGPDEDLARAMDKRINLRLHPHMYEQVERMAAKQGKDVTAMARHMLEVGLKWYRLKYPD